MKKQILNKDKVLVIALIVAFLLIFLTPRSLWSQNRNTAFLGGSITSIGPGLHAGFEGKIFWLKNVALTTGWTHSIRKTSVNPDSYYFTAGYVYQFTNNNSYNISLHGGYAYSTRDIVYNNDNLGDEKRRTFIVDLNIGKDISSGRIYFDVGYVTKVYVGIGMRGYF